MSQIMILQEPHSTIFPSPPAPRMSSLSLCHGVAFDDTTHKSQSGRYISHL